MTLEQVLDIRPLALTDAPVISAAFENKPVEQYVRYVKEQAKGARDCWVATVEGVFAGYVTLVWDPVYPGLAGRSIPEVQDLNVLPEYHRRGIASRLLDRAEEAAAARSAIVAIGVGLHPGYNAAQRLYVLRGYVPDGLGVTHHDRYLTEGESVPFDDELVLHFEKELRSGE
jgi:GNAT superfamily N-acetyltransferase